MDAKSSLQDSQADGLRDEISMMQGEIEANKTRDPGLARHCREEVKKLRAKLRRVTRGNNSFTADGWRLMSPDTQRAIGEMVKHVLARRATKENESLRPQAEVLSES